MSGPGDFDYLLGKHIYLQMNTESPQAYVLDKKLSEHYENVSREEYDQGQARPYAVIKFGCHNHLRPTEQGFLRVYAQIPVEGTLRQPPEVRGQQAKRSIEPIEMKALRSLHRANCTAVPKFLGVSHGVQTNHDYVPGGYICGVGWARVPGEPVDMDAYWKAPKEYRDKIRAAFRPAIEGLVRYGWEPWFPTPKNLIYDSVSKTIHIAGFRAALPARSAPNIDMRYFHYGLVEPSDREDWEVDSSDWTW